MSSSASRRRLAVSFHATGRTPSLGIALRTPATTLRLLLPSLLAAMASLASPTPAHANNIAQCSVAFSNVLGASYLPAPSQTTTSTGSVPTSCRTDVVVGQTTLASAQATAAAGVLRIYGAVPGSEGCIPSPCGGGTGYQAKPAAFFDDTLTPAGLPAKGTFEITFTLEGGQFGQTDGVRTQVIGGLLTSMVGVFQNCSFTVTGNVNSPGDLIPRPAGSCVASAPISAAAPTVFVQESANSVLNVPPVGPAVANYSETARISSIEVLDQDGNVVPGVTVQSASGVVYPVVPEPASGVLTGAGVVALVVLGARRQRV